MRSHAGLNHLFNLTAAKKAKKGQKGGKPAIGPTAIAQCPILWRPRAKMTKNDKSFSRATLPTSSRCWILKRGCSDDLVAYL